MGGPTVIPAGAGELVGDSPERRVEILCEHDALHATWSRFGPRRDGAGLHVHRRHTDVFYVLEGELTVRLGPEGDGVVAPAGSLARVPPLVVHGFGNASDADVKYVNFHAPGQGFASYMRGLHDGRKVAFDQEPPPADGGRPAAEAVIGGASLVAELPAMRVALRLDDEELGIAETSCGAGGATAEHVHRRHSESFYVLEGELAVIACGRELRAPAGSWVQVPAGVPHAVRFPAPARLLDVHSPGRGFGAFLRALRETGDEELAVARSGFDQV